MLIFYFLFANQYIVQIYDLWMGFNNTNYSNNVAKNWEQMPSFFLYFQLKISNSPARKSMALWILSNRKDIRILPILKSIIRKEDVELNRTAILSLVKFSKEEAVPTLMHIVDKYKHFRFNDANKNTWKSHDSYLNALEGLAILKEERIFLIVTDLAINGTESDKNFAFNRLLHHYDNYKEEVLPLYLERLKTESKYKGTIIESIAKLKCPAAIPILKDLAEREPWNRMEAEKAIKYLESLKTIK